MNVHMARNFVWWNVNPISKLLVGNLLLMLPCGHTPKDGSGGSQAASSNRWERSVNRSGGSFESGGDRPVGTLWFDIDAKVIFQKITRLLSWYFCGDSYGMGRHEQRNIPSYPFLGYLPLGEEVVEPAFKSCVPGGSAPSRPRSKWSGTYRPLH